MRCAIVIVVAVLSVLGPEMGRVADALDVGVAAIDITPPAGGGMAGYSDRNPNVSQGVHDPLTARALVVGDGEDVVAFVTLDLAGLGKAEVQAIQGQVKAQSDVDLVLVLCSHTHSGPEPVEDFPSKEDSWLAKTVDRVVALTLEAARNRVPATYGVGTGEVREGHNRRKVNPDGTVTMFWRNAERVPTAPVDHELGVLHFRALDGEPLATLVNFTCHPVVLGPENLLFSADYPGVMREVVEEEVGGTCLFANGACGDINPFMDKSDPAEGAFEEVEKMGRAVAKEVIAVVGKINMHEAGEGGLTLDNETIPLKLRWDVDDPEVMRPLEEKYGKAMVQAYLKRFGLPLEGDLPTVTLGDDLALVGLPGEFFVQHGLDLKARSIMPNTFVLGYCNGSLGYFPTIEGAWQGGYGGKEATIVEVGAGEKFVNRALINLCYQTGRLERIPDF